MGRSDGISWGARREEASHAAPRRVGSLDRWLLGRALALCGEPPVEVVLWDGRPATVPRGDSAGRVVIHDRRALWRLLVGPELHFGDLYAEGRITVEGDIVALLEAVYRAMSAGARRAPHRRLVQRAHERRRANTLLRSRDNVHHHYDLGNDFYGLWLDAEHMQYTCAYYASPEMSLEQAQTAKLEHVCRKLRLAPGDTVLEAGCGWGGLARFMARRHGARVRAFNLSREQVSWARDATRREGLDDRVEFIEDDYRNMSGECDVFVSVGMLEHIGPAHYGELGRVIARCLRPEGRGLLHTIGRHRPGRLNPWIERRIFPGGHPPTLGEMAAVFEPWDLAVQDVENLRLHYADTLRHWLERFEKNADRVRSLFDERFVRTWRLYLAGSIAAFTNGDLQLFQLVFNRARSNALPRTREHLYRPPDDPR
jgi:cyclopropane-fatty-acyl-phospholipid synthase